jgi:glycine/D-amino acid oxidase-like deaminating enzyme
MDTRYGRSPWIDRFPKSRIPSYPPLRGPQTIDAVIVGGGLTGCATAYAFAAAGIAVALVEGDRIGRGRSGGSNGWVGVDPAVAFGGVQQTQGLRAARYAFQSWRRAALDFATLIRRLALKCDLRPCGSFIVGNTPDQVASLRRELKARRDAGLEGSWLNPRVIAGATGLMAGGAIGVRAGATLDPYRAAIGLAAAAARRGAGVFERSSVQKITFTRRFVEVVTADGRVRARKVVIATGAPTGLFRSLVRHLWFRHAYYALTDRIPANVRRTLGKRLDVVRDSASPSHIIRWVDGERLLVSGADGVEVPERQRQKTIVQRTGQLMYELSTMYPEISGIIPAYGWHTPYAYAAGGLPYIGPHRNFPHHLFAFGDSSHGVTGAYLASRILLRYYQDQTNPGDDAFAFQR